MEKVSLKDLGDPKSVVDEHFLEDFSNDSIENPLGLTDCDIDKPQFDPEQFEKERDNRQKEHREKYKEYYFLIDKLVSRFDDLFEEKITYDKILDKNYYEYTFRYCNSWSDDKHLVIKNDIRDVPLHIQKEKIKERKDYLNSLEKRYMIRLENSFEEYELEGFLEWFNYEYLAEDAMLEMECNSDLEATYSQEFLRQLRIRYPHKKCVDDFCLYYNENDNKEFGVNRGRISWSFLRRGTDDGNEYKTKEEAFESYLTGLSSDYGAEDLNNKIKQDIPSWLKDILKRFRDYPWNE